MYDDNVFAQYKKQLENKNKSEQNNFLNVNVDVLKINSAADFENAVLNGAKQSGFFSPQNVSKFITENDIEKLKDNTGISLSLLDREAIEHRDKLIKLGAPLEIFTEDSAENTKMRIRYAMAYNIFDANMERAKQIWGQSQFTVDPKLAVQYRLQAIQTANAISKELQNLQQKDKTAFIVGFNNVVEDESIVLANGIKYKADLLDSIHVQNAWKYGISKLISSTMIGSGISALFGYNDYWRAIEDVRNVNEMFGYNTKLTSKLATTLGYTGMLAGYMGETALLTWATGGLGALTRLNKSIQFINALAIGTAQSFATYNYEQGIYKTDRTMGQVIGSALMNTATLALSQLTTGFIGGLFGASTNRTATSLFKRVAIKDINKLITRIRSKNLQSIIADLGADIAIDFVGFNLGFRMFGEDSFLRTDVETFKFDETGWNKIGQQAVFRLGFRLGNNLVNRMFNQIAFKDNTKFGNFVHDLYNRAGRNTTAFNPLYIMDSFLNGLAPTAYTEVYHNTKLNKILTSEQDLIDSLLDGSFRARTFISHYLLTSGGKMFAVEYDSKIRDYFQGDSGFKNMFNSIIDVLSPNRGMHLLNKILLQTSIDDREIKFQNATGEHKAILQNAIFRTVKNEAYNILQDVARNIDTDDIIKLVTKHLGISEQEAKKRVIDLNTNIPIELVVDVVDKIKHPLADGIKSLGEQTSVLLEHIADNSKNIVSRLIKNAFDYILAKTFIKIDKGNIQISIKDDGSTKHIANPSTLDLKAIIYKSFGEGLKEPKPKNDYTLMQNVIKELGEDVDKVVKVKKSFINDYMNNLKVLYNLLKAEAKRAGLAEEPHSYNIYYNMFKVDGKDKRGAYIRLLDRIETVLKNYNGDDEDITKFVNFLFNNETLQGLTKSPMVVLKQAFGEVFSTIDKHIVKQMNEIDNNKELSAEQRLLYIYDLAEQRAMIYDAMLPTMNIEEFASRNIEVNKLFNKYDFDAKKLASMLGFKNTERITITKNINMFDAIKLGLNKELYYSRVKDIFLNDNIRQLLENYKGNFLNIFNIDEAVDLFNTITKEGLSLTSAFTFYKDGTENKVPSIKFDEALTMESDDKLTDEHLDAMTQMALSKSIAIQAIDAGLNEADIANNTTIKDFIDQLNSKIKDYGITVNSITYSKDKKLVVDYSTDKHFNAKNFSRIMGTKRYDYAGKVNDVFNFNSTPINWIKIKKGNEIVDIHIDDYLSKLDEKVYDIGLFDSFTSFVKMMVMIGNDANEIRSEVKHLLLNADPNLVKSYADDIGMELANGIVDKITDELIVRSVQNTDIVITIDGEDYKTTPLARHRIKGGNLLTFVTVEMKPNEFEQYKTYLEEQGYIYIAPSGAGQKQILMLLPRDLKSIDVKDAKMFFKDFLNSLQYNYKGTEASNVFLELKKKIEDVNYKHYDNIHDYYKAIAKKFADYFRNDAKKQLQRLSNIKILKSYVDNVKEGIIKDITSKYTNFDKSQHDFFALIDKIAYETRLSEDERSVSKIVNNLSDSEKNYLQNKLDQYMNELYNVLTQISNVNKNPITLSSDKTNVIKQEVEQWKQELKTLTKGSDEYLDLENKITEMEATMQETQSGNKFGESIKKMVYYMHELKESEANMIITDEKKKEYDENFAKAKQVILDKMQGITDLIEGIHVLMNPEILASNIKEKESVEQYENIAFKIQHVEGKNFNKVFKLNDQEREYVVNAIRDLVTDMYRSVKDDKIYNKIDQMDTNALLSFIITTTVTRGLSLQAGSKKIAKRISASLLYQENKSYKNAIDKLYANCTNDFYIGLFKFSGRKDGYDYGDGTAYLPKQVLKTLAEQTGIWDIQKIVALFNEDGMNKINAGVNDYFLSTSELDALQQAGLRINNELDNVAIFSLDNLKTASKMLVNKLEAYGKKKLDSALVNGVFYIKVSKDEFLSIMKSIVVHQEIKNSKETSGAINRQIVINSPMAKAIALHNADNITEPIQIREDTTPKSLFGRFATSLKGAVNGVYSSVEPILKLIRYTKDKNSFTNRTTILTSGRVKSSMEQINSVFGGIVNLAHLHRLVVNDVRLKRTDLNTYDISLHGYKINSLKDLYNMKVYALDHDGNEIKTTYYEALSERIELLSKDRHTIKQIQQSHTDKVFYFEDVANLFLEGFLKKLNLAVYHDTETDKTRFYFTTYRSPIETLAYTTMFELIGIDNFNVTTNMRVTKKFLDYSNGDTDGDGVTLYAVDNKSLQSTFDMKDVSKIIQRVEDEATVSGELSKTIKTLLNMQRDAFYNSGKANQLIASVISRLSDIYAASDYLKGLYSFSNLEAGVKEIQEAIQSSTSAKERINLISKIVENMNITFKPIKSNDFVLMNIGGTKFSTYDVKGKLLSEDVIDTKINGKNYRFIKTNDSILITKEDVNNLSYKVIGAITKDVIKMSIIDYRKMVNLLIDNIEKYGDDIEKLNKIHKGYTKAVDLNNLSMFIRTDERLEALDNFNRDIANLYYEKRNGIGNDQNALMNLNKHVVLALYDIVENNKRIYNNILKRFESHLDKAQYQKVEQLIQRLIPEFHSVEEIKQHKLDNIEKLGFYQDLKDILKDSEDKDAILDMFKFMLDPDTEITIKDLEEYRDKVIKRIASKDIYKVNALISQTIATYIDYLKIIDSTKNYKLDDFVKDLQKTIPEKRFDQDVFNDIQRVIYLANVSRENFLKALSIMDTVDGLGGELKDIALTKLAKSVEEIRSLKQDIEMMFNKAKEELVAFDIKPINNMAITSMETLTRIMNDLLTNTPSKQTSMFVSGQEDIQRINDLIDQIQYKGVFTITKLKNEGYALKALYKEFDNIQSEMDKFIYHEKLFNSISNKVKKSYNHGLSMIDIARRIMTGKVITDAEFKLYHDFVDKQPLEFLSFYDISFASNFDAVVKSVNRLRSDLASMIKMDDKFNLDEIKKVFGDLKFLTTESDRQEYSLNEIFESILHNPFSANSRKLIAFAINMKQFAKEMNNSEIFGLNKATVKMMLEVLKNQAFAVSGKNTDIEITNIESLIKYTKQYIDTHIPTLAGDVPNITIRHILESFGIHKGESKKVKLYDADYAPLYLKRNKFIKQKGLAFLFKNEQGKNLQLFELTNNIKDVINDTKMKYNKSAVIAVARALSELMPEHQSTTMKFVLENNGVNTIINMVKNNVNIVTGEDDRPLFRFKLSNLKDINSFFYKKVPIKLNPFKPSFIKVGC